MRPILELVRHAEEMKHRKDFSVERLVDKGTKAKDEVQELAETLDDLYQQIRESYTELEEKNRELAEENERQEIFLRSSSHQLKTPVAAALLLVDGMLNEVGRYKDTKVYLPRVKEQLLSMRKMVEDILYLNHCARDMSIRETDVGQVLAERLRCYQVAVADKESGWRSRRIWASWQIRMRPWSPGYWTICCPTRCGIRLRGDASGSSCAGRPGRGNSG